MVRRSTARPNEGTDPLLAPEATGLLDKLAERLGMKPEEMGIARAAVLRELLQGYRRCGFRCPVADYELHPARDNGPLIGLLDADDLLDHVAALLTMPAGTGSRDALRALLHAYRDNGYWLPMTTQDVVNDSTGPNFHTSEQELRQWCRAALTELAEAAAALRYGAFNDEQKVLDPKGLGEWLDLEEWEAPDLPNEGEAETPFPTVTAETIDADTVPDRRRGRDLNVLLKFVRDLRSRYAEAMQELEAYEALLREARGETRTLSVSETALVLFGNADSVGKVDKCGEVGNLCTTGKLIWSGHGKARRIELRSVLEYHQQRQHKAKRAAADDTNAKRAVRGARKRATEAKTSESSQPQT